MTEIALTRGQVAIVDDADLPALLDGPKWCASWNRDTESFYAVRTVRVDGRRRTERMHAFLLGGTSRAMSIDHINHDTLDNRRANLRRVSLARQKQNSRPYRGGSSPFKGVCWDKRHRKWSAHIRVERRLKFLGRYVEETDAARAYDAAARLHFGEFAFLNFP